jgi:hypothetical protein
MKIKYNRLVFGKSSIVPLYKGNIWLRRVLMKNLAKLLGIIVIGAIIGLSFVGCGGDDDSGSSNNGGNNNSGNNNDGGNNNNGGNNNDGGNNNGGNNNNGNGDNNGGGTQTPTFTPPTKAQVEAFVENYRKTTDLMGGKAAVYIRSITINSYTVDGGNITTNPSPVPENAKVQVKYTVRTILIFNNLTMGERLNIDNFKWDVQSALQKWLKEQGFGSSNINVTAGDTIFG